MTLPTRALGRSGLEITVLGSDQNRDADEVPQILGRLALGEAINNYETVRQRKDGEEIYVSLTISPIWGSTIIRTKTYAKARRCKP